MKLKDLPPGSAYLIGLGSLNTGALILIPAIGIVILWILTRGGGEKS
jgi:hypothetical protein